MLKYIGKRLLQTLLVLFIVSIFAFALIHLAGGNPALLLLPDGASDEAIKAMEHQLGLDQPLYVQYFQYMAGVFQGDLGMSTAYKIPVADIIAERLPYLYCLKTSFGSDQRTFATAPKCIDNTKEYLTKVRERLKGVVIEHRDFEPLIKTYDRKDALFYLDPPYVGTEKYYNVVFTAEDHQRLATLLKGIKGRFILSYDDNPMIRDLYSWCSVEGIVRNTTLAGNSDNKVPFAEVIVKNF